MTAHRAYNIDRTESRVRDKIEAIYANSFVSVNMTAAAASDIRTIISISQ